MGIDFDMTITRYWSQKWNKRNVSAHGLFNYYSKATPEFVREADAIFKKYYPIEVDPTMTHEQKTPFMVEWWQRGHDLIVSLNLTRSDLADMVRETQVELRGGVGACFEWMDRHKVPLLVFSAGIADVIEEILRQNKLYSPQTHIISNRMIYSPDGRITGFHDPLMHVFNKNEFTGIIQDPKENPNASFEHQQLVKTRDHVILIGDSLGDIQMGHGVRHQVLLTIGLMNRYIPHFDPNDNSSVLKWTAIGTNADVDTKEAEDMLSKYQDTFDIVVVGDVGFEKWLIPFLNSISP